MAELAAEACWIAVAARLAAAAIILFFLLIDSTTSFIDILPVILLPAGGGSNTGKMLKEGPKFKAAAAATALAGVAAEVAELLLLLSLVVVSLVVAFVFKEAAAAAEEFKGGFELVTRCKGKLLGLVVVLAVLLDEGPPEETMTDAATVDCPPPSGREAPDVTLLLSEVAADDDGVDVDFMMTVLVGAAVATLLFTPVTLVTLTAAGVGTVTAGGGGVLDFVSAVCLLLF